MMLEAVSSGSGEPRSAIQGRIAHKARTDQMRGTQAVISTPDGHSRLMH